MKLPRSLYNWTSLAGIMIASFCLFMILFLFTISVLFDEGSSYLGLFIYMILPVFLVMGLILIPVGMMIKLKKDGKGKEDPELSVPVIDFGDSRHRNALAIFAVGTLLFILLSSIGSYEAYHYSESVEFCGKLCHTVMEPEYVAYQNSPHARVSCVECHVGPGADWYVKSKLSGLYQVYAVLTDRFPRPITTPITSLRPARETCEECHWPEKFYARKLITEKHYLADEANTEWDITLQMKIGSNYSALGLQEGIHWHINADVKIEYIPASYDRETIAWVRYTNKKTGEVHVYLNPENPPNDSLLTEENVRLMDCMDCHNRPSHDYQVPQKFIDNDLTAGNIPRDLPDIKSVAMEIFNYEFPSKDSAFKYIESSVKEYYEIMYPEIFEDNMEALNQAILAIQTGYGKNIFPEMKVTWEVYPNHIGHLFSDGCHRCHNDKFQSDQNRFISRDCDLCHLINSQGPPDEMMAGTISDALEFVHPIDINEAWREKFCTECHVDLY
nr:NapC/NirT family cytochrome c [Bacteroidota bacterium]